MKELWCVFSECEECAKINKYDPGLPENKEYKFGHLVAIVETEEDAKHLVKQYDEKYKQHFKSVSGLTHFYHKWEGNR